MDLQSLDPLKAPQWRLARLGVLVFFVISGLLLTNSLIRAQASTGTAGITNPAATAPN